MNSLEEARKEINEIDRQMAELFEKRMKVCAEIGRYKRQRGLPVRDEGREAELARRNAGYIRSGELREYYSRFLRACIDLSCEYQSKMDGEENDNTRKA